MKYMEPLSHHRTELPQKNKFSSTVRLPLFLPASGVHHRVFIHL